MRLRRSLAAAAVLACSLLSGCSALSDYAHLARGQYQLLSKREPIVKIIDNPATDDKLRARLKLALEARAFASDHLGLPRNGSYTKYVDLGRPYVLKNIYAATEFSMKPVEHCFPIAGCVAYRGYYEGERAEAEAARLRAQGYDVYVGNVPAYSTLGWFDDPVLNTMMRWDDDELAGDIFHELGHQQLYVKGDTSFNESFATFIEDEGLREWRLSRGQAEPESPRSQRGDQFEVLVLAARDRLVSLYASDLPVETMRQKKAEEIERLRSDYRALRDGEWQGYAGYDGWMNGEINNAKLLPFGLYHGWEPAFAQAFARSNRDWPAFFALAKQLAALEPAERKKALQQLDASATAGSGA